MADLRLGTALALRGFLADYDVREGLEIFAKLQHDFYAAKCSENMIGTKQNVLLARQHAHFALVYDTLLAELDNFIQRQVNRASQ